MDTPAEIAAKKLAWEFESRKSVELRVTVPVTSYVVDKTKTETLDTYEEHYIETAAGQRFCEFRGLLAGKLTSRKQYYGDGTKFADVTFDPKNLDRQTNIIIKRQYHTEGRNDRKQIPPPLLFLYVGRTPLHEALPKGQHLGTAKVMGRECDKFLFPKVRWLVVQDQVFYLDRETSIPLKFEAFRNQESREQKKPVGEWVAESLDKIQGHFVPLKSTLTAKRADGTTLMVWKYTVDSIEFNKEYPASTFWPTPRPGVTMFDTSTGKAKTVPGEKTADKQATTPARENTGLQSRSADATATASTQAVPPKNWTATVSNVSLGLGCAVLLVGCLLWWRR
jgi:hypothetical protein